MSQEYSPIVLGMTYVSLRAKYFAQYTSNYFNPDHFDQLSKFLEREQVNPNKYMDFVFGMLEYRKPLTPAKMANPELILKYREITKE